MTTTTRESILTTLQTKLQLITVTGGYHTTINTVEPYLRAYDVEPGKKPYVCFGFGEEINEMHCFGQMRVEAALVIAGLVNEQVFATRQTAINNLIDDIIAVLNSDYTLGGNATGIYIEKWETDEQDPDAAEMGGFFIMQGKVIYWRTTSST